TIEQFDLDGLERQVVLPADAVPVVTVDQDAVSLPDDQWLAAAVLEDAGFELRKLVRGERRAEGGELLVDLDAGLVGHGDALIRTSGESASIVACRRDSSRQWKWL